MSSQVRFDDDLFRILTMRDGRCVGGEQRMTGTWHTKEDIGKRIWEQIKPILCGFQYQSVKIRENFKLAVKCTNGKVAEAPIILCPFIHIVSEIFSHHG